MPEKFAEMEQRLKQRCDGEVVPIYKPEDPSSIEVCGGPSRSNVLSLLLPLVNVVSNASYVASLTLPLDVVTIRSTLTLWAGGEKDADVKY